MTLDSLITYYLVRPTNREALSDFLEQGPLFPLSQQEREDQIVDEAAGRSRNLDTRENRHFLSLR